jgi:putative addiction module component (TIGR02574 family)
MDAVAGLNALVRGSSMPSTPLSELLKLPVETRVKLAMALWDSLSPAEREAELALTEDDAAELDRRWAEHLRDPDSAVAWEEVLRKLRG